MVADTSIDVYSQFICQWIVAVQLHQYYSVTPLPLVSISACQKFTHNLHYNYMIKINLTAAH